MSHDTPYFIHNFWQYSAQKSPKRSFLAFKNGLALWKKREDASFGLKKTAFIQSSSVKKTEPCALF